ncbi:hypothetical protein NKH81_32880 [Mesorhizobium sp. M0959]|uniref:hypothetical protein n=1 Tax=Mesorhizobium sp. M0959 TaxID=2957034 RepID=UPI0033357F63
MALAGLQQPDIGRSMVAFASDETLVVVVEMSRSTWRVAGPVAGLDRRPLKKLKPDENDLMRLLESSFYWSHDRRVWWWPTNRGGTAFGWPDGCRPAASKPT